LEGEEVVLSGSVVALNRRGLKGVADFVEVLTDCRLSGRSPHWVQFAVLTRFKSVETEREESDPWHWLQTTWAPTIMIVKIKVQ
jgi:hypothetical protein